MMMHDGEMSIVDPMKFYEAVERDGRLRFYIVCDQRRL